ncbi:Uncharacterised protein [Mycobacteroides abscessus subsp. abscessus]|nr:Uncharacterised protein [Mycobacteroides abscessus subsp. abscessus]
MARLASSGACATTEGTIRPITAATMPIATSIITRAAAAGGTPFRRIHATGGHRTVQTMIAKRTGRRITHSLPTTHSNTHTAATTSTACSATIADSRRPSRITDIRVGCVRSPVAPESVAVAAGVGSAGVDSGVAGTFSDEAVTR